MEKFQPKLKDTTASNENLPIGRKKGSLRLALALLLAGLATPACIVSDSNSRAYSPFQFKFIASIDTMKESRDTQSLPLTDEQIAQDVKLTAGLNVTHITVDTNWDYPDYFAKWVAAIRKSGKHIWVRGHPNQWENKDGVEGAMDLSGYKDYMRGFIADNAALFKPGDIFDPCPEAESGNYWSEKYPGNWDSSAITEYNRFLEETTDIANQVFHEAGINGVITSIHSMNSWMALNRLDPKTAAKLGVVAIDSYPDSNTFDPKAAAKERADEIKNVYNRLRVPVIQGELGYNNLTEVNDNTQARVLKAQLDELSQLPYLIGVNYWVGAGGPGYGGYTNLFNGSAGKWTLRPAANVVNRFYLDKV